jgi:outer membrane receptor protein involved in Fe transport
LVASRRIAVHHIAEATRWPNSGFKKSVAPGSKPITLRFDIVNLFDKIYELRDGSGIGVFAPQFGARRGFYAGISQKL